MSKNSEQWLTHQPKGKFSLLPHAVSRSAFLDSYEKNVWCYLSTHAKGFHPSEAMIAENTGIKEKAVRSVIDRLIKKNVIEITNLPRKPGKKKKYRLVDPKHWSYEPVLITSPLAEEQVARTGSSHQKPTPETWVNRSLGPGIENQKENSVIENQQIRHRELNRTVNISEVNPKFRENVAEILTRSKDIESITSHLSSLIRDYTSLNGESPPEVNWLLNKARWWSDQMNLDNLQRESLTWSLISASSNGSAEHEGEPAIVD